MKKKINVCFGSNFVSPCALMHRIAASALPPRNDGGGAHNRHCERCKTRGNTVHQSAGGNTKAFSLIELLISLIIISLIAAAFTPILSKKLKHRELALAAKSTSIDCIGKFGEDCLACNDSSCTICRTSFSVPDGKFVNPEDGCQYQNCVDKFGSACTRCNKDYCTGCKGGWGYNSTTHGCSRCTPGHFSPGGSNSCTKCSSGQYQDEYEKISCKNCETYQFSLPGSSSCTNCNPTYGACAVCDTATCKTCEWGYKLSGTNCATVTCSYAQYVSNTTCGACNGDNQYKNKASHSDTSCDTCGTHQKANSAHTGCVCENGYHLEGGSCTETVVECTPTETQYKENGECKDCSSKYGSSCTKCDATSCLACASPSVLIQGGCKTLQEPTGQEDCQGYSYYYDKTCITTRNAGDSGGPSINVSGVESLSVSEKCAKVDQFFCCWQATSSVNTAKAGCTTTGYNACTRTVCQFEAAKKICENYSPDWAPSWELVDKNILPNVGKDIELCAKNKAGYSVCETVQGKNFC